MDEKGCVIAMGMFDGLHRGHRAVLNACKSLAESLNRPSAVYTFIENPKTLFGGIPFELQSFEEKVSGIKALGINHVFSEHFTYELAKVPANEFLKRFVKRYEPSGIVAGADYTFGDRAAGSADMLKSFCDESGIACVIIPLVTEGGEKISSTRIRAAIKSGDTLSLDKIK